MPVKHPETKWYDLQTAKSNYEAVHIHVNRMINSTDMRNRCHDKGGQTSSFWLSSSLSSFMLCIWAAVEELFLSSGVCIFIFGMLGPDVTWLVESFARKFWCPGNVSRQGISSHSIDLVLTLDKNAVCLYKCNHIYIYIYIYIYILHMHICIHNDNGHDNDLFPTIYKLIALKIRHSWTEHHGSDAGKTVVIIAVYYQQIRVFVHT